MYARRVSLITTFYLQQLVNGVAFLYESMIVNPVQQITAQTINIYNSVKSGVSYFLNWFTKTKPSTNVIVQHTPNHSTPASQYSSVLQSIRTELVTQHKRLDRQWAAGKVCAFLMMIGSFTLFAITILATDKEI